MRPFARPVSSACTRYVRVRAADRDTPGPASSRAVDEDEGRRRNTSRASRFAWRPAAARGAAFVTIISSPSTASERSG